jgi:hypothetical protein
MTLDDRLTKVIAYGVDWTEFKDKSEEDHTVSTYAGKIKTLIKDDFKFSILSDLLEIIEQSRTESEWHIDGNVAIHKTGFITEQELRDKVKEYCK